MKNMKIRSRLAIAFGILLLALLFVSLFSMSRMVYLADFSTQIYEHPLTVGNAVRDAGMNIIKMHRGMKDVTLAGDREQMEKAVAAVNRLEQDVYEQLEIIKEKFLGDTATVDSLKDNFAGWKPIRDEVIALTRQNEKARAAGITRGKGARYVEDLEKEMGLFIDFSGKKAGEFLAEIYRSEENSVLIVALIDVAALLLSLAAGYLITRSITRPVALAAAIAERLSGGDIAFEIPDYSSDETGRMLAAMKTMAVDLREQLREITEVVSILAGSTAEISSAAAQFATTTQEVAVSVSQVMVSMREVKQTTQSSSEKAREMKERSGSVVETSRNGEAAVLETIQVINTIQEQMMAIGDSIVELSDKGQAIAEIIAAVDDVADQSRLLAVNASIEAVKAGEQGKGFTVVADEIKNMAEQSKQSTSQVRTILTDIRKATGTVVMAAEKGGKAVENGVRQATQTGNAIQTLTESIEQTSHSAIQIEATSRQQATGIEQVFSAIESINTAMRQNADSAKQMQNSMRALDDLGKKLKTIVGKYNV